MGNSLRCCLSCILPFGALDLIRIVHINGQVDHYSQPVSAAVVMAANPDHVLTKPCSEYSATTTTTDVARRIALVSPDSDLKRGHIYFLVPISSLPEKKKIRKKIASDAAPPGGVASSEEAPTDGLRQHCRAQRRSGASPPPARTVQRRRRGSARVGAWRQQLESIAEDQ